MGAVPHGGHLEVPWAGSGETVLGTCIGELGCNRGSWHMVRIEWTGGLAFIMLSRHFRGRFDASHTVQKGECHGMGDYHHN